MALLIPLGGCTSIAREKTIERQLPGGWKYTLRTWHEHQWLGGDSVCAATLGKSDRWWSERIGEFRSFDKSSFSDLCGFDEPVQVLETGGQLVVAAGTVVYRKLQRGWEAWSPWTTEAQPYVRQFLTAGQPWKPKARSVLFRSGNGHWVVEMEMALANNPKLIFLDGGFDPDRTRIANASLPGTPFPSGLVLELEAHSRWHGSDTIRLAPPAATRSAAAKLDPSASRGWQQVDLAGATLEVQAAHGTEDPRTGVIYIRPAGHPEQRQLRVLTVGQWDASGTGSLPLALRLQQSPKTLTLDGGARILDPVEAQTVAGTPQMPIFAFAVSPDGQTIAASGLGTGLFRADTGQWLRWLDYCPASGARLSFSLDSKLVLSDALTEACIWDAASGRVVSQGIRACGGVMQVLTLLPDGGLAAGCQERVEILSPDGRHTARVLEVKNELVSALAISPDGRLMAGGTGDRLVRVWELPTGRIRTEWRLTEKAGRWIEDLRFSPDARALTATTASGLNETRLLSRPTEASAIAAADSERYTINPKGQLLKRDPMTRRVDFALTLLGSGRCCLQGPFEERAWIVTRPGSLFYDSSEFGDDYAYVRARDGRMSPLRSYRERFRGKGWLRTK